jgi:heme/copper-type cytochrome/quinol oxidase subunit 2
MPWNLASSAYFHQFPFFIVPLMLWSVVWTGLALWNAAKRNEKWWFIFFMLVHTAGIVEILYLLLVVKVFGKKASRKRSR